MWVRPAPASTVITISSVGGARHWTPTYRHLLHSHSTGWPPGHHSTVTFYTHILQGGHLDTILPSTFTLMLYTIQGDHQKVTYCHLFILSFRLKYFMLLDLSMSSGVDKSGGKYDKNKNWATHHITTQLCSAMHSGGVKNVWDSLVSLSEQSGVGQGCRPKQ